MKIYVANLSSDTNEEHLIILFSEYGKLKSVKLIKDPYSGESRRFGFIEMEDESSVAKAISGISNKDFMGRRIVAEHAKSKQNGHKTFNNSNSRYTKFSGNKNY